MCYLALVATSCGGHARTVGQRPQLSPLLISQVHKSANTNNQGQVKQPASRDTSRSKGPRYYDIGLYVGICGPVLSGIPAVLISPVAFLQRPAR